MHDSQNKFTFHLPLKGYKMKRRHTGEADIYCDHHLCQLLASDTGSYLPSKNSLCSLIKLIEIVALSCVVTSDSQKLCEPYSVSWAAFSDHLIWHLNFLGFCSCFCAGDSALQGFRFLPLFCRQHLLSGRHVYMVWKDGEPDAIDANLWSLPWFQSRSSSWTYFPPQIGSHVLAYSNSCINPILYAFFSVPFRRAFLKLVRR